MGTWSTAILGNDTAAEVAEDFKRMYSYQEGGDFKWSTEEITDSLYTYSYETIQSLPSEKCNVIFALALALWKKGELTDHIKELVRRLIYEKIDENAWKDLDADEKTLKSRWKTTTKFYEELDKPFEKITRRQLQDRKISLFTAGTCLAFEHNSFYYGILVANDGRNIDDGSNDLLFLNIKNRSLPSLEDFKNAEVVLNKDLANFLNRTPFDPSDRTATAYVFNFSKAAMKKFEKSASLIGVLHLTRTFLTNSSVCFNQLSHDYKAVESLLIDAFNFWEKKKWNSAEYKPKFESKVLFNSSMIGEKYLDLNGNRFFKKDIFLKVENGLWHVDVTMRIDKTSHKDIEKCWTHFIAVFEHLINREVNNFTISNDGSEELTPFAEVDFSKFKMQHVKDSTVI